MQDLYFPTGARDRDRRIHFLSFGTGDNSLVWLHANGMNARSYASLLEQVSDALPHWRILAVDLRGHGRTSLPAETEKMRDWITMAEDLLPWLAEVDGPLVLAGHSLGGILAARLVELLQPRASAGLCMVEPVLLLPYVQTVRYLLRCIGVDVLGGMVERAKKRRQHFEDVEQVRERYRNRGMFAGLENRILDDYLADGLVADGDGVRLSCPPAWEAAIFDSYTAGIWPLLRRLRLPATLLTAASKRSTCSPAACRRFARLACAVEVASVQDSNHFLPLDKGREVADFLVQSVRRFASGGG